MFVATALDPRFKSQLFDSTLKKNVRKQLINEAEKLKELREELTDEEPRIEEPVFKKQKLSNSSVQIQQLLALHKQNPTKAKKSSNLLLAVSFF